MSKTESYKWLQANYLRENALIELGVTLLILATNLLTRIGAHDYTLTMSLTLIAAIWSVVPVSANLNTALQLGVARSTLWRQTVRLTLFISLFATLGGALLGSIIQATGETIFTITASLLQPQGQTPQILWRPDYLLLGFIGFIIVGLIAQTLALWIRVHGKFAGITSIIFIFIFIAISTVLGLAAAGSFMKLTHPLLVTSLSWSGAITGLILITLLTRHAFLHTEVTSA